MECGGGTSLPLSRVSHLCNPQKYTNMYKAYIKHINFTQYTYLIYHTNGINKSANAIYAIWVTKALRDAGGLRKNFKLGGNIKS